MPESPPQHQAESDWNWVETPDPAQMAVAVHVQSKLITTTNKPRLWEPLTDAAPSTFSELDPAFGLQHLCGILGIADWYFIGESIGAANSTFYFFKNKTDEEINTPFNFKGGSAGYTWPEVLKKAVFDSDPNIPLTVTHIANGSRGVAMLPRWFVRLWRRNERPGTWPTKIFEFLSWKPWYQNVFDDLHFRPDPEPVEWDLAGHSHSLNCLHEDTRVPIQSGAYPALVRGESSYIGSGTQQERICRATNMTDWGSFTVGHSQSEIAPGLFKRTQEVIQPPPTEELVVDDLQF